MKLIVSMNERFCSPHAHDHSSVTRVMLHVCFALLPCTLWGLFAFGFPALNLLLVTIGAAILTEAICLHVMKQPLSRLYDGSALLTGLLMALCLPPWAPWWIGVGASFFAIAVGKQIYGGIGQNLFNPAMLARVALLISFPIQMTMWPLPFLEVDKAPSFLQSLDITFGSGHFPDGVTGATYLSELNTELSKGIPANDYLAQTFSWESALYGLQPGSLGETSVLLALLGGAWLLFFKIISWHIPISLISTVAILSSLTYWLDASRYGDAAFHLLSGSLIFGAFFIATDLVTSPSSKKGQIVFGAGCGFIDFIIRVWAGFPEGTGFAILFMNTLTPLIDQFMRPRIYGRQTNGKALQYSNISSGDH